MLNVRADSLSSDRQVAVKGKLFFHPRPGCISRVQAAASVPSDASNVIGVPRVVENALSEELNVPATKSSSSNGHTEELAADQIPRLRGKQGVNHKLLRPSTAVMLPSQKPEIMIISLTPSLSAFNLRWRP